MISGAWLVSPALFCSPVFASPHPDPKMTANCFSGKQLLVHWEEENEFSFSPSKNLKVRFDWMCLGHVPL